MSKPPGHRARKRFGQNFLHDHAVIERIVAHIHPQAGDRLVEIGPGMGALTELLLEATEGQLHVVELDRDLIPILRTKFFNYPGLSIHEADALNFDFNALASASHPLRLVGNLPYNISTPLIFHLLENARHLRDMHFMLQKEVVQRMAAQPGQKEYGRLSIMCQYYCQVDMLFEVGPGAFNPAPKVDSAIVRLQPHAQLPCPVNNIKTLKHLVTQAFNKRRKTIRNGLSGIASAEQIASLHIDPSLRPENLSLKDYVNLANLVDPGA